MKNNTQQTVLRRRGFGKAAVAALLTVAMAPYCLPALAFAAAPEDVQPQAVEQTAAAFDDAEKPELKKASEPVELNIAQADAVYTQEDLDGATVEVDAGSTVVFDNVELAASEGPALRVLGADATVVIKGACSFVGADGNPGIEVPDGASLALLGAEEGAVLNVRGGAFVQTEDADEAEAEGGQSDADALESMPGIGSVEGKCGALGIGSDDAVRLELAAEDGALRLVEPAAIADDDADAEGDVAEAAAEEQVLRSSYASTAAYFEALAATMGQTVPADEDAVLPCYDFTGIVDAGTAVSASVGAVDPEALAALGQLDAKVLEAQRAFLEETGVVAPSEQTDEASGAAEDKLAEDAAKGPKAKAAKPAKGTDANEGATEQKTEDAEEPALETATEHPDQTASAFKILDIIVPDETPIAASLAGGLGTTIGDSATPLAAGDEVLIDDGQGDGAVAISTETTPTNDVSVTKQENGVTVIDASDTATSSADDDDVEVDVADYDSGSDAVDTGDLGLMALGTSAGVAGFAGALALMLSKRLRREE